jgi:hypothetical protein
VAIVTLLVIPGYAAEHLDVDRGVLVQEFLRALTKESPTLADYLRFFGPEREIELSFELMCCKANGWEPYGDTCIEFTRKRALTDPHGTRSLALTWMKSLFPVKATVHILRTTCVEGTHDEETVVGIGPVQATFIRGIDPANKSLFGEFALIAINGVSIYDIIDACEAQGNCTCLLPH